MTIDHQNEGSFIAVPRHGSWLAHYGRSVDDGAPIGSGRYRKGSGEKYKKNTYQSLVRFRQYVERERAAGKTDKQIRASMNNMDARTFNARIQLSKDAVGKSNAKVAKKMHDAGLSNREIGRRMGVSDKTIANYLKDGYIEKRSKSSELVDVLKRNVDKYGFIDVGKGINAVLGCSKDDLEKAVSNLKEQGYAYYSNTKEQPLTVKQLTTDNRTQLSILAKEGATYADTVHAITEALVRMPSRTPEIDSQKGIVQDPDGNWLSATPLNPTSVDSSRILIRYAEEGGLDKDGFIELRRGVPDIDLGKAHYAQVRIAVDDKLYLKGMAAPSDDVPDGYDIVFNTNKKQGTPLEDVLKPMKDDPANPFGASIKPEDSLIRFQKYYIDPKTGERKQSAINVVNEEGDWDTWNRTLSSQLLFKQPLELIKSQLGEAYRNKAGEFEEIMNIQNPTIRRMMLSDFADSCKTATWKMQGAPMPGQSTQVLLPLTTLKDIDSPKLDGVVGEVYAPNYPDGTELVLCRFPMAHVSELPRVINNLSNKEGQKLIGTGTIEAIGVSPKIRQQMSGADTDGDTVVAIPDPDRRLSTRKMFEEMKDFDPATFARSKDEPTTKDHIKMKGDQKWNKQKEMGSVSNLILDMHNADYTQDEIIRAMKHSMVVIDAEKHNYDWKESEEYFGIEELKEKYQGGPKSGASTIVSRRNRDISVKERKEGVLVYDPILGRERLVKIDAEGNKVYTDTGRTYKEGKYRVDEDGNFIRKENGKKEWVETGRVVKAKQQVKLLNEVEDAFEVTSGGSREHPGSSKEAAYAETANAYKALERRARLELDKISDNKVDKASKADYEKEIASIKVKLNDAEKNAPYERQAQFLAGRMYRSIEEDYNTKDEEKKGKSKVLSRAREVMGASRNPVVLTQREVEAINHNAVSADVLVRVYKNSNKGKLKESFTPKDKPVLSGSRLTRMKSMAANGVPILTLAAEFDVSTSTILRLLGEKEN